MASEIADGSLTSYPQVEPSLREPVEGVCAQALGDAAMGAAEVDAVLLAGGATRASVAEDLAQAIFGQPPLRSARPEETVALGAAAHAAQLFGAQYGTA